MFLDQELKEIQEAKNRLAVCSDLRRQLVHVEVRGFCGKGHRVLTNLTLGLAVAGQLRGVLRERKANRRYYT